MDFWTKLDIWMSNRNLPIRIIYDSFRIFLLEHCTIRATALAYTSLLAAVPFMILITSISFSLGIGDLFINNLPTLLPNFLETIMPYITAILHKFLPGLNIEIEPIKDLVLKAVMPFLIKAQGIRLGSLGVIGGVGLLVTFILAIDTIEVNMNIVWGVNESRGYGQKAAIFIPFLLLFAGGIGILSIIISYAVDILRDLLLKKIHLGHFGEFIIDFSIPVFLLIFVFLFLWLLYCYMPYVPEKYGFWRASIKKTKKRWFSAIISALFAMIASIAFIVAMSVLQAGMFAKWSLFYGSLAFFPMLMFLLFGFWCIILFGNALCWRITERQKPKEYFLKRIENLMFKAHV